MTTLAVATAHSLVLTVSHDLLFRRPLRCGDTRGRRLTGGSLSVTSLQTRCMNPGNLVVPCSCDPRIRSRQCNPDRGFAAVLRTPHYARHSQMRAEPMKLFGLNLAIPFAVRSGFRCSGFRFTCRRCQPLGAMPPIRDALGVQGGAAPSFRADSVTAS